MWLLDALASDCSEYLEEDVWALGSSSPRSRAVAFSHELARLAIEESMPLQRWLALHRAALDASSVTARRRAGARPSCQSCASDWRSRVGAEVCTAGGGAGVQAWRAPRGRDPLWTGAAVRRARSRSRSGRSCSAPARSTCSSRSNLERRSLLRSRRCTAIQELGVRAAQGAALAFLAQLQLAGRQFAGRAGDR